MSHSFHIVALPSEDLFQLLENANTTDVQKEFQKTLATRLEPFRLLEDCPEYSKTCTCVEGSERAGADRVKKLADDKFGSWKDFAIKFERENGKLPPFAGLTSPENEAALYWQGYMSWLAKWNATIAPKLEWIESETKAEFVQPYQKCKRCSGTGTEKSTWRNGKFDYFTRGCEPWRELNAILKQIDIVFPSGRGIKELQLIFKNWGFVENVTTAHALKFAIQRAPELLGASLLFSDGRWLEQTPRPWGLGTLESGLGAYYADDEAWPMTLFENTDSFSENNIYVCVDCHS